MPSPSRLLLIGFSLAFLASCAGTYKMREGMTREQVAAKLGQPLRIDRHAEGGETWYYTIVKKAHTRGIYQNYERPGETVSERDFRIETQGVYGGVEFGTTEEYEEKPLRFDAAGRLTSSPPYSFLPRE